MASPINILNLYQLAFGYVAKPAYSKGSTIAALQKVNPYNNSEVAIPAAEKLSALGVPMYMPLTLDGFDFPFEPLIEIKGGHRIIETDLDGFEPNTGGTVKEEWHLTDYKVTIRAVVQAEGDYPEEYVRQLRAILEAPGSKSVVNRLCTIFGIEKLTIYDYDFPGIPGFYESQAVVIECKSDKDYTLIIQEPA